MKQKKRAILVLGMHRSGTSALTRVLNLMGLQLSRDIIPPLANDNETGFWESQAIVEIHNRLLAQIGSSWDDCLAIPESFFDSDLASDTADEILTVLKRDFAKGSDFVVKDPRICRLVPLWLGLLERFDTAARAVLILRHPYEVAASLARRNTIPETKALHLWLRHILDMERYSRDISRSVVAYPSLLEDWQESVKKIAADLALEWRRTPSEAKREVEGFLSKTHRHHEISRLPATGDLPRIHEMVAETWSALLESIDHDRTRDSVFDRIADELAAAEGVLAPTLVASNGALRNLQEEAARLHDEHRKATEVYETEIAKIRQHLEEFDAKIHQQKEQMAALALERDHLLETSSQAAATYEAEIAKIREVMDQSDARVHEKQRVLEEVMLERDRFEQVRKQDNAELEDQIQQLERRLERQSGESRNQLREARRLLQEARERLGKQITSNTEELQRAQSEAAAMVLEHRDLTRDLKAAAVRSSSLETNLADLRSQSEDFRQQNRDLGRELADAKRDKDWLWERWHETKAELASPRESKIGRIALWQWDSYLRVRNALVKMKARVATPHGATQPGSAVSSSDAETRHPANPFKRLLGQMIRAVTGALGWLYLYPLVHWEHLRARIRARWRPESRPLPHATRRTPAARLPRVLLVSPYSIYPANHGGGVRLYNLIQRLADDCELHLLIFSTQGKDPEQRKALEPWVKSTHFHHWQPRHEPGWWNLQPPNAGLFKSDLAARQIAHLLASKSIDILQLEYAELGQYGLPEFARVKVVLTEHDLAFRQHWRRRKLGFHHRFPEGNAYGSSYGDLLRLTRYELAVCRRADQVHVMSDDDGQSLSTYLADGWDRLRIVPNAVDTAFYNPAAVEKPRQHVLYVGNFQNLPNVDALEYMVEEIWPLIRARRPEVELNVVGAHPSDRITRFSGSDGIQVVGSVPDLQAYYHSHRLMVAPIRAGSGTRLKILEAFAAGLPVVSTTLGAEGIAADNGEHLMLADDPETFADCVDRLLGDEDHCQQLAGRALCLVRESYDWQRSAEATLAGWAELLSEESLASAPGNEIDQDIEPQLPATPREPVAVERAAEVSIVIPTFRGGAKLERCLEAISQQETERSFEIVCIDSGSPESDLESMRLHGARVVQIDQSEFDHGLTRDLGAEQSSGEIVVFLNQDAIPENCHWLDRLTKPLFEDENCAAVQGGIVETSEPEERFFWDSCGERFYFTRESDRWIERYFGIGFSTVNAAIRRQVWQEYPFGRAAIMEDKLWQKRVVDDGHVISERSHATVTHTHNYHLRLLWRRCLSEGFGWRLVGEPYSFLDMVRDGLQFRVHKDLFRGIASGQVRTSAEFLFPWVRPLALYWGNHWSRGVKL